MSKYAHKLKAIAAAWPADPFRPNMQLKHLLASLATHPRLTPDAVRSARVLLDNGVQHRHARSPPVPALDKDARARVHAQTLSPSRPGVRAERTGHPSPLVAGLFQHLEMIDDPGPMSIAHPAYHGAYLGRFGTDGHTHKYPSHLGQ
ncbi:hypothetical protein V8E55_009647 [Tylopilus felleus]